MTGRHVPAIKILGVPVARLGPAPALSEIERLHDEDGPALVFYANAHTLNLASRDAEYKAVLQNAGLVLNDGFGLNIAARIKGGRFPANLNGSDFSPQILGFAAKRGWSSFFLGARPGVAEEAARRLETRITNLRVAGLRDGYFPPNQTQNVVDEIQNSGADLLMVAMGNPLQERWLSRYLPQTGARLGVGVGAFFDFTAGTVPRAPGWMNRMGVEWLYRFGREPRRMWRRYVIGNPEFLARVTRERLGPGT